MDDVEDRLNFFQAQQYVHFICTCCVLQGVFPSACLIKRQSVLRVKKGKRGACEQKAATVLPNRTAAA